jgi:hypothetical protein
MSLFYTGRGEVEAGSCDALRRAVFEIDHLLLVPLIQGTLRSAILNDKHPKGTQDSDLAGGYAFARSVLPLVQDADEKSASTIATNMAFQFDSKPIADGPVRVFGAFARVYRRLGVDCSLIGNPDGFDSCTGESKELGSKSRAGLIVGILVGVAAVGGIAFFLVHRRRRQAEKPLFVTNGDGEMNHDTDILGGKFSSYRDDPHEPYLDDHNGDYHDGALNQTAESLGSVGSLFSDQAPIV